MTETLTITGRRLSEIKSGFLLIKERTLPTLNAEVRVATQFKALLPAIERYDARRRAIEMEHIETTAEGKPVRVREKEMHEALLALADEEIEIPAPRRRLAPADLPLRLKSDDSETNREANAAIMVALAPEFFELPDEPE